MRPVGRRELPALRDGSRSDMGKPIEHGFVVSDVGVGRLPIDGMYPNGEPIRWLAGELRLRGVATGALYRGSSSHSAQ